jgi:hypothetical protein
MTNPTKGNRMKRSVIHIVFDARTHFWTARAESSVIAADGRRDRIIQRARLSLRDMAVIGYPGQLIVHTKTGRIAFENTYLRDPVRSRG